MERETFFQMILDHVKVWRVGKVPEFKSVRVHRHLGLRRDKPRTSSIQRLDGEISRILSTHGFSEDEADDISLAYIEAVTNAYDATVATSRSIRVDVFVLEPLQVAICIEDHGTGFDPSAVSWQLPDGLVPRGRGLWIERSLVDALGFNERGDLCLLVFQKKHRRTPQQPGSFHQEGRS